MKRNIFALIFCGLAAIANAQIETDSVATSISPAVGVEVIGDSVADKPKADSISLDEVVVTGKLPTTKFTDTGLIYDMKADPSVRTMSLLEALRKVPMVTVSADDEIRVKGNSSFAIYLNGRPYRVAQSDPKAVLGSIQANTISKIELITELDGRYDAEAGSAIINIITVKNALDGYTVALNGRINTKPEHERFIDGTNDGLSLLATKGRVNMMLGYNYTLQNVLNQPMSNTFTFFNQQGEPIRRSTTRLRSVDGNFNYHTGRMMLEWMPDSVNSLYVDGHAFFDHHFSNAISQNVLESAGSAPSSFFSRSYKSSTSGTAEANVIYRNYYHGRTDLCRLSLGYRFALDPEKETSDFTISDDEACADGDRTLRTVNGHLQEHTFNADYALPLSAAHTLRLGAKDIIRLGKTRPEYSVMDDGVWQPMAPESADYDGAMDYSQNIAAVYAAYNGRAGKFNFAASLRGEYSRNSFSFNEVLASSKYTFFDVIPRLSVIFNPSPLMRYTLTYNTSVARPGIGQLDPFRNIYYPDFENQGNPDLRQSRTHSVHLTMLKMSQKLVMQASVSANRCNNPIVDYYSCDPENGTVLMSSINFARHDYLSQNLYVGYEPTDWLSFTFSGAITENWFRDKSLGKKCFGLDWNIYAASDFTLPHSWTLGAQLILNRMFDDPYTVRPHTMVMPAFYANKNFLDGKLTVGLAISSPFSKYIHSKSEVRTPQFTKAQRNDILDRGLSLKVSYRLSGGKRASLSRDTSLRNEDLSTGVN